MNLAMTRPDLIVVIPALNEEANLPATLASLAEARPAGLMIQVVVVDGGSGDRTADLAKSGGAKVVSASGGRGAQLAAGARAAAGSWLLFLHADTRLSPGWAAEVLAFVADPAMACRAGYFALRLDDPAPQARRIERLAAWRARWLGLPYGDQGLLIGREAYESLGGYKTIPLMEDVEFARRIGGSRLVALKTAAATSAARYRRDGWLARPLRNLALLTLYYLGVPPARLRRLYG